MEFQCRRVQIAVSYRAFSLSPSLEKIKKRQEEIENLLAAQQEETTTAAAAEEDSKEKEEAMEEEEEGGGVKDGEGKGEEGLEEGQMMEEGRKVGSDSGEASD